MSSEAFGVRFPHRLPEPHNGTGAEAVELPPTTYVGGMTIAAVTMAEAAEAMGRAALARRGSGLIPQYITSTNGQVLALYATDPEARALFDQADIIHADGMPIVFASKLLCGRSIPERVATTDLVHDVMRVSTRLGLRHFLLGAKPEVNARAIENLKGLYPDVPEISGHHGYFRPEDEAAVIAAINAFAPDVLWVSLGVPLEQKFISRNRARLTSVGVVKTSGGLFDFIAGTVRRAPKLLQNIGLEWAWRAAQEPERLAIRYGKTNPVALWLLATRSR
jgi:N-acetylglucosaminyldiphosphoundecaprenol N-acetyl-beta-D-mannosaminyltransferase